MTIRVAKMVFAAGLALVAAGCSSWATSDSKPVAGVTKPASAKPVNAILVTENDITDRKYKVLGEVSATVNKTTIFNKNPTREMVAAKLKQEAAKLGADAVIQVRYGNVGVSVMSWGSLSGKGRAVAFVQ